jgi:hypothetical protein
MKQQISNVERRVREVIFSVVGTEYTRIYRDPRKVGHRTKIYNIHNEITAVDIKKINRQTSKVGVKVDLISRPYPQSSQHSLVYNIV